MNATTAPAATPSTGFSEVTPAQAKQWIEAGQAILIDVRENDEHQRERIAGATLLPLTSFNPAKAATLATPGQRIVFHCRSGRRSIDACRLAVSSLAGAETPALLATMTGGIEAWKAAGLPVVVNTAVARISVMRQVQLTIGSGVLLGSALAWFVHPAFVGLSAFFGAGLIFAGATGTCGLASLLSAMPWNKAAACSNPGAACR